MAYWVLYIDVFFLSFDGNAFDVAWAAVVAALRDTRLPAARWDPDREMVVCSRREPPPRPLAIQGAPVACTAAVFSARDNPERPATGRYWLLLDPDAQEELLCDEVITAVVDCTSGETRVLSLSKHGGSVASPEHLKAFIRIAEKRWEEFQAVLKAGEPATS